MKTNLDTIKDMSRKVGSTDAVQYLIDTYGYAEAQNVANLLYDRKNKSGGIFDIGGALGLEQRKGASITAKQLAEFVTPAMSVGNVTDFGRRLTQANEAVWCRQRFVRCRNPETL